MKFVKFEIIRENSWNNSLDSWTNSKLSNTSSHPGKEASVSRRALLRTAYTGCAGLSLFPTLAFGDDPFPEEIQKFVREARFYEKLPNKKNIQLFIIHTSLIESLLWFH